jgi:prepilin-type N-terminal cleavage/methylation domain-containing protein
MADEQIFVGMKEKRILANRAFTLIELLVVVIILAVLLSIIIPALRRIRSISPRMLCGWNMTKLGEEMLVYANDNDEKYPTHSQWCDLLLEYTEATEEQFQCYGNREERCSYAMNPHAVDMSMSIEMVMLFETRGGWNRYGGPDLVTYENHEGEGCNVLYIDTHVSFERRVDDLYWEVTAQERLFEIIVEGEIDKVRTVLGEDTKLLNAKTWKGWISLHGASMIGNKEMAEFLIANGADVDARNKGGLSPLHCTAGCGYVYFDGFPGDYKVPFDVRLEKGMRYLDCADEAGYIELAKFLISKGAEVRAKDINGEFPLYIATQGGSLLMVQLLLDEGADVTATTKNGETCLYIAAKKGSMEMAELFISKGADANAGTKHGGPLSAAASSGIVELCKLLVSNGASVKAIDYFGGTALHSAQNRAVAEYLISEGADIHQQGKYTGTPLHSAAASGRIDVVELLIEIGADVNARDRENRTPLYEACSAGDLDMVKFLISHGADINAKTYQGETALKFAIDYNELEIAELLREYGGME